MSEWTLAGSPVLGAELTVPASGPWMLRADVSREEDLTGAVELVVGGVTWGGAVLRGGVFEGRWRGWVVGGAGGWRRVARSHFYRSVPARVIASDLAVEVGEQLAADAPGLDVIVPMWTRQAERADAALSRLLHAIGRAWRVLPDGAATTAAWPEATTPETVQRISYDPATRMVRFGAEDLSLLPGVTVDDGLVCGVIYTLDGPTMRAEVALV